VKYPKVEGTCGISPPETLRRVFGDQVAGGTVIKLPAVSPSPSFECAHIVDPSAVARFPAAMVVHPATSVAHHPKQMPSTSGTSGSGTTGHHPMIDPALSAALVLRSHLLSSTLQLQPPLYTVTLVLSSRVAGTSSRSAGSWLTVAEVECPLHDELGSK
jgi:hypothetical protein